MDPNEQFGWLKMARSLAAMNDQTAEDTMVALPIEAQEKLVFALELLLDAANKEFEETDWWPFLVTSCLKRRLNYFRG